MEAVGFVSHYLFTLVDLPVSSVIGLAMNRRINGPPWPAREVYRDDQYSVTWHGRCGLIAHDNESGIHLWGGRCAWSILIAVGMEARAQRGHRDFSQTP